MNLREGTLLQGGKYRIERFINSGGFGCTYDAEHTMLGERVAIKEFFVKDFCNRDEATAHVTVGTQSKKGLVDKLKKKFIEEAKMLCQMQHPNIVRVSDVFEENGTAYFVMDYIDGSSLKEIVDREGTLSEERAVRYIRQVADTLRYVHGQDRLHLDIKPGNIMVDNTDNAILIDFGTSKQYDEVDGENTSTLIGKTPGYAPLEQMGNDVVKFMPATDIYALGATLYKLLTGVTPLSAILLASGEKLKPLPKIISASTRKAITAAMNINKAKRPQNVDAFLALLGDEKKETDEATLLDMKPKVQRKSQSRAKSAPNSNSASRSTSQTAKEQQSASPTSKKSETATKQVRKSRPVSSTEKDAAKAHNAQKPRARTQKVVMEPTSWWKKLFPWIAFFVIVLAGVLWPKSAEEQYEIGKNYYYGRGNVSQDNAEAVKWFRKAAEQGLTAAQIHLGLCYEIGQGVTKDYTEAVKWYRKAAEQGLAAAQNRLGLCYEKDRGVTKDYTEAVKWYRKAAEQGLAAAQNRLGLCYEKGQGVTKDYTEAVKWYRKAAEQGNADAKKALERMREDR